MDCQKKILNNLVDKFERSKSFLGENAVTQSFSIKPEQLFSGYSDDANLSIYQTVNREADELASKGFVTVKKKRNGVISTVVLCVDKLDEIYSFLKRTPRKDANQRLNDLITAYLGNNELLDRYCRDQLQRLSENKTVKGSENIITFETVLKTLANIFSVEQEMYQRDFSIRFLGDSKALEKVSGKVKTILMEYGEFDDIETVFEDLNIVKNPGHVYFKGAGKLEVNGQIIDFSKLPGDMGLSSRLLDSIDSVCVLGKKVITIENLTTFHSFSDDEAFVIYLGGYHNTIRRRFITRVYEQNPNVEYYHFGDMDAGGFHILLHLKRKTGIPFVPFKMDIETLNGNKPFWKSLTANDCRRLEKIKDTEFSGVVQFMLDNGCKMEQEALD